MKVMLVFQFVVAALLVFAAFAKLQSMVNDALYFRQFNLAAVSVSLVEFTIAALLLLGGTACFTWQLTAGLFCVFAVVNAHSILIGQKACGCLGDISLQAKWMLAVDLVTATGSVVAAVACSSNRNRTPIPLFNKSAKLGMVMLLSAIGLCALRYSGASSACSPDQV